MNPTAALVEFVATLRHEDVPPTAVAAVKVLIADALACALAGSAAPLTPEIVERHVRWGGAPEATVLTYGDRLPAPTAAWLNAAMMHAPTSMIPTGPRTSTSSCHSCRLRWPRRRVATGR